MEHVGINLVQFTGFVGKRIITFENREGVPGIRFYIWVGAKKPFGFYQMIAVYGSRAVELSKELEPGDLVFVSGKKMIMNFSGNKGYSQNIDTVSTILCYVIRKSTLDKEIEK